MKRFEGRNAVVTGASRGIGANIARRLASEGANVVVVARTLDRHDHLGGSLIETVHSCQPYGTKVVPLVADLSDESSRAEIMPTALEVFGGRVDVLVNNAAAAIYEPILTYPLRRRRVIFEVNVHATADLMQAVLPSMLERHEGWIVNISSAGANSSHVDALDASVDSATHIQSSEIGIYGASKAALNRMTYAFAQAVAGQGIRINTLAPRGAVLSDGALALMGDRLQDESMEPMEAMVEGVMTLCDCDVSVTGGRHYSLGLLESLGRTVMTLDGSAPYIGTARGE